MTERLGFAAPTCQLSALQLQPSHLGAHGKRGHACAQLRPAPVESQHRALSAGTRCKLLVNLLLAALQPLGHALPAQRLAFKLAMVLRAAC